MANLLPEDVTLADLLAAGRVSNPARYLRMALANVLRAGDFGTVTLRIGRTGNGTWPMYILERDDGIFDRFDGQNHKPWTGEEAHHDENWSNKRMTGTSLHDQWQKATF
jgi:hypothetical protein